MYQEEIQFENTALKLTGTLYLPDSDGRYPVLTVAHAAGAGTRDFGVYQRLARTLAQEGIGVFVFDRRGSGSSGGNGVSVFMFQ